MTRTAPNPLAGVELLLVDGTNLLHAIRRGAGPAPSSAVIGRLRAAVPADVRVEIVFDGPPPPGSGGRIAHGVGVRYAGRISADDHIRALVDTLPRPRPGEDQPVLVVTDDAELRRSLRDVGVTTARTAWLMARLDRTTLSAPSVGAGKAPRPGASIGSGASAGEPGQGSDAARRPWRPGRGATSKTGNPRKPPKRSRRPPGSGC